MASAHAGSHPSVPFDPVVGVLVQYLHDLIEENKYDGKYERIRLAVFWALRHAPLLCREARAQCFQYPNRPWLVTFEIHNPRSYVQKVYADEYLTYVHPAVTVEGDESDVYRPPCHPDQHEPIETKRLKKRWLYSDSTQRLRMGQSAMGGDYVIVEDARTYIEASLNVLNDRILFVNRITSYDQDEKEVHENSRIRDPWLYKTSLDLCTVPLPEAVVCFVAFLRFQHIFIRNHGHSRFIGAITTRCDLHGCNRPIKPERVPYESGHLNHRDGVPSRGINGHLLPSGMRNASYWRSLRLQAIQTIEPESVATMVSEAEKDELMKSRDDSWMRPYAHAACYSFCSSSCRKEFHCRFQDQLLCIPCAELEPVVSNRDATDPRSLLARQFEASLVRNKRVLCRMAEMASRSAIRDEFNVYRDREIQTTVDMLNVDTAIIFAASIVRELPASQRRNVWLPTTQNWRAVERVKHSIADQVRHLYNVHQTPAALVTDANALPRWMHEVGVKALSIFS